MKKLIPQAIKNIYHLICSIGTVIWFGFPARKIKVVGITGTNGKTTTTQMTARILEEAGYKVAVSSTINFKIGDKEWVNKSKFTTRDTWQTQRFIQQAVSAGCDYLVLEVASHALHQHRLWGIKFDVVAITNVTREHLDYHKTILRYRKVKAKLFRMLKPAGSAVVNLEMDKPEEFIKASAGKKIYGYKIKEGGSEFKQDELTVIQAEKLRMNLNSSEFTFNGVNFKLQLIGGFNVENALAAVSVGLSQGVDLQVASLALAKIKKIPGRMDYVANDRGLKIIIDYALTPDSMEKLGKLISEMIPGRAVIQNKEQKVANQIIWVFGSCGERDRGKRPIMGEIVSRYADYVIVTNEDPYGEDPWQIIDEVYSGIKNLPEGKKSWRIMDRREAIKKALNLANKGDIILITGKGAEETMAVSATKRIKWNDRMVIVDLLKNKD